MTPPCLVWLPADHRLLGEEGDRTPHSVLADQYALAVRSCAGAQALVFPLAEAERIAELLQLVDGVLLTGSPSNVHPSHFGEALADTTLPLDRERDALTLPLVQACIEYDVPLLGVCRGFQEINVAMGGSLHQRVHGVSGMMDHREPANVPPEAQYQLAHTVKFVPGSMFARWAGGLEARVNSLHGQGVHSLAPGLRALGHAPDGLVEAVEIEGARSFAYAVQWHPEWACSENRFYAALFEAFGAACRLRQKARLAGAAADPRGRAGSRP